jgi:hypothetical protein
MSNVDGKAAAGPQPTQEAPRPSPGLSAGHRTRTGVTDDRRGTSVVADEIEILDDDGKVISRGYVGLGDPRNPYNGELLSEGEEKRIDAAGDLVVEGLPWSQTGTGLYLIVGAAPGGIKLDRKSPGASLLPVSQSVTKGANLHVSVGCTLGKPTVLNDCVAASLELPVDLAQDPMKIQYVTEWVAHTAIESLGAYGLKWDMQVSSFAQLAAAVAGASENAIAAWRL